MPTTADHLARPRRGHAHDASALLTGLPSTTALDNQRLAGMLGLAAPDDHGEERRLLLPPARHGHSEHGPGDAALGVADLGLVGEVGGEADACLGHGLPSWDCLAGRSALPLEPGDGGHRGMPPGRQGQATEPTKSAMHRLTGRGRLRCRVGWRRLRLVVGHASTVRPDPSTLGMVGERGSHHESCSQLVPGARPELDQVAESGGGVVVTLAAWPASPVRVAALGRSDLLDDRVWSLLGQDVQEGWPVE